MIVKKTILKKVLSSGFIAEFLLVKQEGRYEAALFLNGKHIYGPNLPTLLTPPKDDLTHWMGSRPTVGLIASEAEKIFSEVECENKVLSHRESKGWDK
jgi:hypothetical protein